MKPYIHPALGDVTLPAVMQALSDPCRIEILRSLMDAGELACGDIPLDISKATVSPAPKAPAASTPSAKRNWKSASPVS